MKQLKIFLILSLLNISLLFAQDSSVKSVIGTFVNYTESHPVEKIYLHLDKPYYTAGEYMYFRAYLTDMQLDQNEVTSHIIYVEITDSEKNLVRRAVLYSEQNEYAGQILLPDSLPAADYHLRAYTNWMRNAGEDYFFHRDIFIGNTNVPQSPNVSQAFAYNVTFFPEGGCLLEGLSNKVSFKALANDGFGVDITGILYDTEGNELLQFNSLHLGMGSFTFTPEKGKTYKAIVQSGGLQQEFALPAAIEGLAITAQQDAKAIYLTIRTNSENPGSIYLIGQSRNTVCYALEGVMSDKEIQFNVNKNDLMTGILQFTLFKDGLPVSERLMFVDFNDDLRVNITPGKAKYESREEAFVQIQVTDRAGRPVEGSFSLAVTDDKTVRPSNHEHNIKGSLLLDADLKGYIESPGWYFAGNEPERAEALDDLLCTQGWSRFVWEQLSEQPVTDLYPYETDFQITGTLTNQTGKPIVNALVEIMGAGNPPATAFTDENGRFVFSGLNCPETAPFTLQCMTKQDRRTVIQFDIDKPEYRQHPIHIVPPVQFNNRRDESLIAAYTEQSVRQIKIKEDMPLINLPEVVAEARKIPNRESFGTSSQRFGGKTLDRNITIQNLLRTLPTPNQKGVPSINSAGFTNVPVIYDVDGTRMHKESFDGTYGSMQAKMFELVEVISPEDALPLYGREAMNGAYKFTIKKFTGREYEDVSQFVTNGYAFRSGGYSVQKEFYVPAYDNPDVRISAIPDLRTTIYWNPVIRTDRAGRAEVRFFAADNPGSYSYIVEGIGDNKVGFTK